MLDLPRHLFPLAADVTSMLLYLWVLPRLVHRLQERSLWNAALFAAAYAVFCFSIYLIRCMDGTGRSEDETIRSVFAFLAVCFSVFFTVMMIESAGIPERIQSLGLSMDTLGGNLGLMFLVLLGLAFVFVYPALVFVEVQPSLPGTGLRGQLPRLISLFGVNLMIVFSVAHWEVYFGDAEPYEGLALGGKIVVFTVVFVFFLFFYASPRLLYLTRNPSLVAAFSFLFQTGFYLWRLMDGKAWRD